MIEIEILATLSKEFSFIVPQEENPWPIDRERVSFMHGGVGLRNLEPETGRDMTD